MSCNLFIFPNFSLYRISSFWKCLAVSTQRSIAIQSDKTTNFLFVSKLWNIYNVLHIDVDWCGAKIRIALLERENSSWVDDKIPLISPKPKSLKDYSFTSTLCYSAKKSRNVTKTSSSILTLLWEPTTKLRLHLYSMLFSKKNPKCYINL